MDNAEQMFASSGKTKKNKGLGELGIADKAPFAPANKKMTPALFSGGSSEDVGFDKDGRMSVSGRKGKPYLSSESQTSTFEDFQKGKRSKQQQQLGY